MNTQDKLDKPADNSYDLAVWLINFEFQDPRNRHMSHRELARVYATKIEALIQSETEKANEIGYIAGAANGAKYGYDGAMSELESKE